MAELSPGPPEFWWIYVVVPLVVAVFASSGLWAFLQRFETKRSATTQLLLGIAHEQIIARGMSYIDRGYITTDEYKDFLRYLYQPYSKFGGNGLAERVMKELADLPMYSHPPTIEELKEGDKT